MAEAPEVQNTELFMDKLSDEARKELVRSSTDRLRSRLMKRGLDEDDVYSWDRNTVLETYAKILLETGPIDTTNTYMETQEATGPARELELKAKELAIREAELRFNMSQAEKGEQMRREEWTRDDMIRLQQQQHETSLKQLELDSAMNRQKVELEARVKEREEQNKIRQEQDNTLINRTKRYADALKHIMIDMPTDSSGLVEWFQSIDSLYQLYDVPCDLQAKLLLPKLTGKARILVEKLSLNELDNYEYIKSFLLEEFHITARELRSRFMTANKRTDETFTLFASRLHTLLLQYLRSRQADSDINILINLLVADRLKECMSSSVLQHVLGIEGRNRLSYKEVASKADIFNSNFDARGEYRANQTSSIPLTYYQTRGYQGTNANSMFDKIAKSPNNQAPPSRPTQFTGVSRESRGVDKLKPPAGVLNRQGQPIVCWRCKGNHKMQFCDQPQTTFRPTAAKGLACLTVPTSATLCEQAEGADPEVQVDSEPASGGVVVGESSDDSEVDDLFLDSIIPSMAAMQARPELTYQGNNKTTESQARGVAQNTAVTSLQLSELETLKVAVNGREVIALIDSGSQFPLVRQSLLTGDGRPLTTLGIIAIQPITGPPQQAKLVACHLARVDNNSCHHQANNPSPAPHVICAAIPDLACYELILPPSVAKSLAATCIHSIHEPCLVEANNTQPPDLETPVDGSVTDYTVAHSSECDNGDEVPDESRISHSRPNFVDLLKDQQEDETLHECAKLAKQGKGGYFFRDSILFHKERVCDQNVDQIVLPYNRRQHVLKLAHDKCGFHQRHRKTIERIRLTFYWPGMRKDIVKYCDSCEVCQLNSRLLATDRTPIDSIDRPELPGQHVMMDCIGPINPPSSQRHKYLLVMIDVCSSWPFIYPIKNLTAQSICDCLVNMFSIFGVPSVISSDNGSNVTSQLTRCLLERVGCCPRYATPAHPSCHGKVERLNGSIKRLLHHVIIDKGRKWNQFIPFIEWTLRESASETTGVSPYTLVFGHPPRGVLNILKEFWTGEQILPSSLKNTEIAYLEDLRNKLATARDYADRNAAINQERYVQNYNKNTKTKRFEKGETVVVLIKDRTNHLLSRWQIGKIAEVKSPFSYLVDLPNGARAHIHIDKIRPFTARVQAVIFEQDKEFGQIETMPPDSKAEKLPSQRVERGSISHLNEQDQKTLLNLLDEFCSLFSDHPGFCSAVEHEIITLPNFVPRRARAYKIPEILKPEIDRQIDVLLRDGFIRPSTSPMASGIVCVIKKSKNAETNEKNPQKAAKPEVRMAIDYRYLNSFTQFFPLPVPEPDEVIRRIAKFPIISIFDARSGYHQLAIKKNTLGSRPS